MIKVEGKGCISATIVADSISDTGARITTWELEYNRYIHSELMTHRLFSRNAMSSRAVPVSKMIEQVRHRPATPIEWGKNQSGMQAKEIITDPVELENARIMWLYAAHEAANCAERLNKLGLHKQIVNRILEPFQIMKTVMTTTEVDNFFYLRCHKDAQPEIHELADCMYEGYQQSEPEVLKPGEWHTPYVRHLRDFKGELIYTVSEVELPVDGESLDLETALKVSSSCCAQVSYRLLDDSVDKALMIYDRLVESKPVHASPLEHQATPMVFPTGENCSFEDGATHMDKHGKLWSGNLKCWIQYRQLIPGNNCYDYKRDS